MAVNADFHARVVIASDEFGDYLPGSWLRSPHLSRHRPFSEPGCVIYVKVGHLAEA